METCAVRVQLCFEPRQTIRYLRTRLTKFSAVIQMRFRGSADMLWIWNAHAFHTAQSIMARCRGVVVVSGAWAISSKQWSSQYCMGVVVSGIRRGGSSSCSDFWVRNLVPTYFSALSPARRMRLSHGFATTSTQASFHGSAKNESRDCNGSTGGLVDPNDTTVIQEYTVRVDVGADNVGQDSNVGHDVVLSKDHTAGMLKLFRDCLRLVQYIAPRGSNKHGALKQSIVSQFKSRAAERDADTIQRYQADAVRALSNYLLLTSITKKSTATGTATTTTKRSAPRTADDAASAAMTREKVHAAMQDYHERSVQEARQAQKERKQVNPISTPASKNDM
jgi:hypothetical protein